MTTPQPAAGPVPVLPSARRGTPWGARLLAAAGFLLAGLVVALIISQQVAYDRARDYLRDRYHMNLDVPVKSLRPDLLSGPTTSGRVPPLGFCWTAEIETDLVSGEVMLNPWTHEVVHWRLDR